jgi:hypothetical protein
MMGHGSRVTDHGSRPAHERDCVQEADDDQVLMMGVALSMYDYIALKACAVLKWMVSLPL